MGTDSFRTGQETTVDNNSKIAEEYVDRSPAAAVDAIDTTGVAASSADVTLSINIPVSVGGEGSLVTILLDADQTTNPAEDSNKIAIGISGKNDAQIAALIVKAVNGITDSLIDFASSGVGTAGVGGITAAEGSSNTQITLTMDTIGSAGNVVGAIASTSGVNIVDVTSFTGGAGPANDVMLYRFGIRGPANIRNRNSAYKVTVGGTSAT